MKPPGFWQTGGWPAELLAPLGAVTGAVTARRVARPGWRAPVPVLCAGNATVGGTGKTPVVIDFAMRLRARGIDAHILVRGYGGATRGTILVEPARHAAAEVGDEALLLAAAAPCWVGADRAASARAAVASGAAALLLDDGLQNPALTKDLSVLVIDGAAGFGNGRLLPAGPLREPPASAARRCQAAILIGTDRAGATAALPPGLPVLHARLTPGSAMRALAGRRAYAFAGIGRPAKFFTTLREACIVLAGTRAFPDHHPYRAAELAALRRDAAAAGAILVTTEKDYVRLPVPARAGITALAADFAWDQPSAIDALLGAVVP
jgi:tetraacyldisaccharide 4'-kinase